MISHPYATTLIFGLLVGKTWYGPSIADPFCILIFIVGEGTYATVFKVSLV